MQNENNQTYMTAGELSLLANHPLKNKLWAPPSHSLSLETDGVIPAALEAERVEDENLEMSVAQCGVQVPVIITADKLVVDGARRIAAALKADVDMRIPVYVCDDSEVMLIIANSILQQKSYTKFQRLFVAYPLVRATADALVQAVEESRIRNLNTGMLPKTQALRSRETDNIPCVGESVVFHDFGRDRKPVELCRLADLAQLLNVSVRYLTYVKGVYDTIDQQANVSIAQLIAHRAVFQDGTPIERIASAVAGSFSERNPEEEAKKQTFTVVASKAEKAMETLLERISRPVYLSEEHLPEVEKQLEMFALKLPPTVAELLAKSLKTARLVKAAK